MITRIRQGVALAAVAICATAVLDAAPETFTATASVKRGTTTASAPVTVTVNAFASEADREAARKAIRDGGTKGLKTLLAGKPDAGFIRVGERQTPIKIAVERASAGGRLITVLTAEPIVHLGAGLPDAKPAEGYDVAIAMFELQPTGPGVGDLSPGARVALDGSGAFVVQDYGSTVVWLNNIAKK